MWLVIPALYVDGSQKKGQRRKTNKEEKKMGYDLVDVYVEMQEVKTVINKMVETLCKVPEIEMKMKEAGLVELNKKKVIKEREEK